MSFDRARLAALLGAEVERFTADNPRSRALFEEASRSLLSGVRSPYRGVCAGLGGAGVRCPGWESNPH
jgi:hypothetical protein